MEINHRQLIKLINKGYETKVPIDVKGAPGIGKSEIIRDTSMKIAEKEKKKFVFWNEISEEEKEGMLTADMTKVFIYADIRLAQMDQTDLKGFPNTKADYAKWVPTLLFKVLSRPTVTGIIFFDEMNLAVPSVIASAYSIVNDHLIGETPISKGVYVISAGNRLSDTSNVFDDPAPLNNRRANVVLLPPRVRTEDGDDWTTWASENGIDSRIVGYLNAYETKLFKFEEDQKDPSFPTPRSWARLSSMIKGEKDNQLIKLYAAGLVGEGIATEFLAFIKLSEKINVRDILNNPTKMKAYSGPDKIDQRYSIVATVAEMFVKEENILNDALALMPHMEPEFGIFMLRMMKGSYKSNFSNLLMKAPNFKTTASEFIKYFQ
jgi:hypothetical protein